ncbi:MAG: succinyldiaminopimelate transaminase [Pseudomonadota bacterium]|jgi:N-succinyldiaminopimelate aminotransferase
MNPLLETLQPYPFERLAQLNSGAMPPEHLAPILLSIGEPKHPTPEIIRTALVDNLSGLSQYPATRGIPELRQTIAAWLEQRFKLNHGSVDPERHVLPCSGTREALFALAQAIVDPKQSAKVLMPNPFYQIYEGAALLAGATPIFLNATRETGYLPDFAAVPDTVWQDCQLIYICSPANPSGAVMTFESLASLIKLSERFNFVIASDECYSEIYHDESNPPPGLLEVAQAEGIHDYRRLIVFHSLSKRSNAPGLRSGFVAGDAALLKKFLLYRTYHGAALSVPVQKASIAAWKDESHVLDNRALYRQKFSAVSEILKDALDFTVPEAGFYLWPKVPGDDQAFARALLAATNVTVLPGSFLSREAQGMNPGAGHIRMALVAPLQDCIEAAHRIKEFTLSHSFS